MTESDHAKAICRHLDQGAEHVSLRVQSRLAAARARALERLPSVAALAPGIAALPRPEPAGRRRSGPSWWWRLAAAAAPALLVIAGIFVGDAIRQDQSAQELAEVDTALLTDEIPLMAYADHGFGVYLKNTRR